jgi:putative CocE/NonD family hydrolase
MRSSTLVLRALAALIVAHPAVLAAQDATRLDDDAIVYINSHSDKEDMVMMPMRDGVRLYGLVVFPKNQSRKNLPSVLIRTPYLIVPDHLSFPRYVRSFLEHGYAVVFQYERGRYYSEGEYHYLGRSDTDGFDTVQWITKQPWSNGKLGTIGCSASAEVQHRLEGAHPPGLAATVPIASGAGIGRYGPYNEHGNFYRGGAVLMGWFNWYYGYGYTYRPTFPANLTQEQMLQLHRHWSLEPDSGGWGSNPLQSGIDTAIWTLPINKIMSTMGAPPSDLDEYANRLPNDPRWKSFGVQDEGEADSAPMLMINSWYDLSIGPNTELYQYQAAHAASDARKNMFMIIAPTTHCQEGNVESEHTVIGERELGDARFDYVGMVQRWFDRWVKGIDNGVTAEPKVRAYMMGANQWRSYDTWPPKGVTNIAYHLDSDGRANSALGDGRLSTMKSTKDGTDGFVYDPMRPVPSHGGTQVGWGISSVFNVAGPVDQSSIELRDDVLIYSTPPLTRSVAVTGPVFVSLYLSSDRKDTDLTVKLLDVYPDGKSFNLDETIQRVRWRDGWDRPVFMEPGKVYKVNIGPLVTSNEFLVGHRLRIEVSSSNFPSFERNLNTGGNNYDEATGLVAHNVIHHGPRYPSAIVLPVLVDRLARSPQVPNTQQSIANR